MLLDYFNLPSVSIVKGDARAFIVADEFEGLNDPARIWIHAKELLELINGVGTLELGPAFRPFELGAIEKVESRSSVHRKAHAPTELTSMALNAPAGTKFRLDDGAVRHQAAEAPATKAFRHGFDNPDVAFVLSLLNEPTWRNLHIIHERIERVLKDDYRSTIGRSRAELKRFVRAATDAGHDPTKYQPQPNAPSYNEAVKFFRENVTRWIDSLP